MKKQIDVAVGVLVEKRDDRLWIFVTRRPWGRPLGGFWEFPGGKVEPGETPRQCLVREWREEVGVAVRITGALKPVIYDYEHGRVYLRAYLCQLESGQVRPRRGKGRRWVSWEQLPKVAFPPANAALLAQLRQRLPKAG